MLDEIKHQQLILHPCSGTVSFCGKEPFGQISFMQGHSRLFVERCIFRSGSNYDEAHGQQLAHEGIMAILRWACRINPDRAELLKRNAEDGDPIFSVRRERNGWREPEILAGATLKGYRILEKEFSNFRVFKAEHWIFSEFKGSEEDIQKEKMLTFMLLLREIIFFTLFGEQSSLLILDMSAVRQNIPHVDTFFPHSLLQENIPSPHELEYLLYIPRKVRDELLRVINSILSLSLSESEPPTIAGIGNAIFDDDLVDFSREIGNTENDLRPTCTGNAPSTGVFHNQEPQLSVHKRLKQDQFTKEIMVRGNYYSYRISPDFLESFEGLTGLQDNPPQAYTILVQVYRQRKGVVAGADVPFETVAKEFLGNGEVIVVLDREGVLMSSASLLMGEQSTVANTDLKTLENNTFCKIADIHFTTPKKEEKRIDFREAEKTILIFFLTVANESVEQGKSHFVIDSSKPILEESLSFSLLLDQIFRRIIGRANNGIILKKMKVAGIEGSIEEVWRRCFLSELFPEKNIMLVCAEDHSIRFFEVLLEAFKPSE